MIYGYILINKKIVKIFIINFLVLLKTLILNMETLNEYLLIILNKKNVYINYLFLFSIILNYIYLL
jgi:hypothetical protein